MLWVWRSLARKSSTWAISTEVLGPSETTEEKPTPFLLAQSRMEAVSAPDCDTSASEPGLAIGPAALALSCKWGRCSPRPLGPSRNTPSRRAIFLSWAASSALMPLEITSAERQVMRPAISSAAAMSAGGSAMMARSAPVCARSASVPVVLMSKNCSVPVYFWARSALCNTLARGVRLSGSSAWPAKTTMDSGAKRGVR